MKAPARIPTKPVPAPAGTLRVTERYLCVEGEGGTLGAATFLLRLSGCDLRCWWCDSKFSSFREDEAQALPWRQLADEAVASGAAWASLTGGEPTWRGGPELRSLAAFCRRLKRAGLKVKVESNGRRLPAALAGLVDLWSLAPKWDHASKAGPQSAAMNYSLPVLRRFVRAFGPQRLQLKFVITFERAQPRARDLDEAEKILKALPARAQGTPVFFIPEAYAAGDYLERCRALEAAVLQRLSGLQGYDLRVQPQWHRVLHGDDRGR
jgi:7-carboxy-7-deazaguanine synthase